MRQSVVITGGSGGLGGRTSRFLAERGWQVFAADLAGERLNAIGREEGISAVELDVTRPASLEAAVAQVSEATDGLDGLVNFAGILAMGSLVEIPVAEFERVIGINFLGTFRVNHAFFPLLHARRGRIVNISSETGWQTVPPFNGPYAISKHAIEAYSDALRRELAFLDMHVVKIQPGPFKTDMVDGMEGVFDRAVAGSSHFAELLMRVKKLAANEQAKAHDPLIIAEVVHEALTVRRPKIAYSVKPDRMRALLNRLPERLIDVLLKRVMGGR